MKALEKWAKLQRIAHLPSTDTVDWDAEKLISLISIKLELHNEKRRSNDQQKRKKIKLEHSSEMLCLST